MGRHKAGWVRMHRTIFDDFQGDALGFAIFSWLYGLANHQDNGMCQRGQIVTSRREIAGHWKTTEGRVYRCLKRLEKRGRIVIRKRSANDPEVIRGCSLITICNYGQYQGCDALGDPKVIRKRSTTRSRNEEIRIKKKERERVQLPNLKALWNANCGSLPRCQAMSASRSRLWKLRYLEKPELSYWEGIVHRLANSEFCSGQNDRGWKASIDFLLKPDTHIRAMEGKYSGAGKRQKVVRMKPLSLDDNDG